MTHSVRRLAAAGGRWCWPLIALLTLGALATGDVLAQDLVIFGDDDRLAGEIKGLERGKLSFNTDSTGTISIEWDDVLRITSSQRFQVGTADGNRHVGVLGEPENPGTLLVETPQGRLSLDLQQVVALTELEQTLLEALDIDLSVGYNYSKASDIAQLNIGWGISHQRERRFADANFNANTSSSDTTEASQRVSLDGRFIRLLDNRWLWGGLAYFDSNDELNLDLRSSLGVGMGRFVRQSNSNRIILLGGLAVTEEKYDQSVPDTENQTSLEGLFAANFDWFRFDDPELDVSMRFTLFPNLTDTGRFRAGLDVDFNWEVFRDLFLGLSLYHRHDSDPGSDGTQNDYGVTTSIGWEF